MRCRRPNRLSPSAVARRACCLRCVRRPRREDRRRTRCPRPGPEGQRPDGRARVNQAAAHTRPSIARGQITSVTMAMRPAGPVVSSQMRMLPSGVYGQTVPSFENVTGGRPPFSLHPQSAASVVIVGRSHSRASASYICCRNWRGFVRRVQRRQPRRHRRREGVRRHEPLIRRPRLVPRPLQFPGDDLLCRPDARRAGRGCSRRPSPRRRR